MTEGRTIAPNEDVKVENCHVLSRTHVNNPEETKDNLLKDNPWITESGFSPTCSCGGLWYHEGAV